MQIAPFDVEFSVQDFDLDFTHMRDHLKRLLAGEISSLFTLSSQNAVVKMLGTGGPRVLTYQVGSRRTPCLRVRVAPLRVRVSAALLAAHALVAQGSHALMV